MPRMSDGQDHSSAASDFRPLRSFVKCCRREGAGVDRAAHSIGTKIRDPFDREQPGEFCPRTIDAAFDGTHRTTADLCGLLVGKSRGTDQDQGFALIFRQLRKSLSEFLELDAAS